MSTPFILCFIALIGKPAPVREVKPGTREYAVLYRAARPEAAIKSPYKVPKRADALRISGDWAFAFVKLGHHPVFDEDVEWACLFRRESGRRYPGINYINGWRVYRSIVGVKARATIARERTELNPRLFAPPGKSGVRI